MKTINACWKPVFFTYAVIATLFIVSAASCAIDQASIENVKAENVSAVEPIPSATPKKPKSKKKVKGNQKTMDTQLVSVPAGIWGAEGIIVKTDEKGVTIQYECADGRIEQPLMMDVGGNFAVNGIYYRQRGGPIRSDLKQFQQPVRYEGKISGETMTLKITDTESKDVIGEYTLRQGKIPKLTRCAMV